jgi:hypothetical protein
MRRIVIAAMSLCLVSLAAVVSADTLVLRDGSRIEGTMLAIAGRTITFQHANGLSQRYPTSQVAALEFVSAESPRALTARRVEAPGAKVPAEMATRFLIGQPAPLRAER